MFYAGLKNVDSDACGPYVGGETAFWIIVWYVLEAYVFADAVRWLRVFAHKTEFLFDHLGLESVA